MGRLLLKLTATTCALFFNFTSAAINNQPRADRVDYTISFQGITSDLRLLSTSIMPEEKLSIRTDAQAIASAGQLRHENGEWHWTAPEKPGRYTLSFMQDWHVIILNVFVLTPFNNGKETDLNGYEIGTYRKTLFKGLSTYAEPLGFIDMSHGPADLQISPHFTLGQFVCKQVSKSDHTYLLIRPETLIKLETLLEAANEKGWKAETLHVMSGFRTPYYNRSIGNRTTSSRHLYSGAADIWLDGDGDGQMDDLNKDGRVDKADARELAKLAEQLAAKGGRDWPVGGIGVYGANAAHGPFIHIDSRGYKARWGHK